MTRPEDGTSSFTPPDMRKAEIIDAKPMSSSSFKVFVDGRSVSGSTRVDLTQVAISGVRLPTSSPTSREGQPTST